jgi:hypothetical protein
VFESPKETEMLFDEIDNFLKTSKEFSILTEEEIQILILSLANSRGEEGFTEDEAYEVVKWAESVRIGEAMLENVLLGMVDINWKDSDVVVKISDKGRSNIGKYLPDA